MAIEELGKPFPIEDKEEGGSSELPTKKKEEKIIDPKASIIIGKVFAKLGRPVNFLKYSVRHIFATKYRVNIFLKDGSIHDSFFIEFINGEIAKSNPEIIKRY